MSTLEYFVLKLLKTFQTDEPEKVKEDARSIMDHYDRDCIPDFVEALANGNVTYWKDVIDVACDLIRADLMKCKEAS